MYTIRVLTPTFLKRSPVQSSTLPDNQKRFYRRNDNFSCISIDMQENSHYRIVMEDGIWYAFSSHITFNFPWYFNQRLNKIRPSQTCNTTCVAMAIAYYYPEYRNKKNLPDELTAEATQLWGEDSIYYHAKLVELLQRHGVQSNFVTDCSVPKLLEHLASRDIAIFSGKFTTSGHLVMVHSSTDGGKSIIYHDPWGVYNTKTQKYLLTSGENCKMSIADALNLSYNKGNLGWIHLLKATR